MLCRAYRDYSPVISHIVCRLSWLLNHYRDNAYYVLSARKNAPENWKPANASNYRRRSHGDAALMANTGGVTG